MKTEKMDDMLKVYFSRQKHAPEKGVDCPSAEILEKYVSGALKPNELYDVRNHIRSCDFCNELIEGALLYSAYGKHINLDTVPDKVRNKAKSLHPAYKTKENKIMNNFKRNIWLIVSLTSILASFFIPRYFIQFLILAVIFGLKWVFNRENTRALIMIYNAWKKHDKDADKELDQIFKNRF